LRQAAASNLSNRLVLAICGTADDFRDESRQDVLRLAASGFRNFTRIAASGPTVWRDVSSTIARALLEMLASFTKEDQAMACAFRRGDTAYIDDKVTRGRKLRRSLIDLKDDGAPRILSLAVAD
jgi:cyclohexadieny/prephenate dehydrogenase